MYLVERRDTMTNQLLSKKTLHYLFIINRLHAEDISIEVLMDVLKCSRSTIQTTIESLNAILVPSEVIYYNDVYSLIIPVNDSFDHCIAKILDDSFELTLLEKIFFEEEHSYLTLAEQLFTSESTIRRTISSLNQALEPFDIQIKTRPIRIIGNERLIRILYFRLFIEKYGVYRVPFDESNITFIKQFYHLKIPFINRGKNLQAEKNFTLFSLVGLQREKNQHSVDVKAKNTIVKLLVNWMDKIPFWGINKLAKTQSKDTMTFLSNVFYLYLTDDFFAVNDDLSTKTKRNKLGKIEKFTTHVLVELNITVSTKLKAILVRDIYDANYGFLSLKDTWVNLTMNNNEYNNFYTYNQTLLDKEIIQKNIVEFLGETQLQYLPTTYFLMQTRLFNHSQATIIHHNIGVFIDFDKEFNDYLYNELAKVMPAHFQLINLADKKYQEQADKLANIDLLVTNIFNSQTIAEEKIYRVSRFFSEDELMKISNWAAEQLSLNKKIIEEKIK
ncbi:HTH domain-containing protein [Vagococcus zengguangii]|nr:HTH domain-containing protein [Vagococcus zengguangii]